MLLELEMLEFLLGLLLVLERRLFVFIVLE